MLQDIQTLDNTGYSEAGCYRIFRRWIIQDIQKLGATGYSDAGCYGIFRHWMLRDIQTLDATGYSDAGVVFKNLVCDECLIHLDFYDGCL